MEANSTPFSTEEKLIGEIPPPTTIPRESYLHFFGRYLRFGSLAWGRPVAQIAMIRQELVEEEKETPF